uniref:Uncharacterized protein n=2 Tax=Parascaris univalens TaxID=6257 RepID=A0A914ZWI1_PARUN
MPPPDGSFDDSDASRRSGYESITPAELMVTPPTYVVRETSDGRLVNDSFGVEWPQRPSYGRYSLDAYEAVKRGEKTTPRRHRGHQRRSRRERSNKAVEIDDDKRRNELCNRKSHRSSRRKKEGKASYSSHTRSTIGMVCTRNSAKSKRYKARDESDDYLFVGALSTEAVAELLKPNDFRIYYQMPTNTNILVPVHIPLCLAYRSTMGKVFHFPIVCNKDAETGKEEWRVQYGDPRSASFASLPALVRYHKIYSYMDPKTGIIDTFPVWRGSVIDVDDFDFD